MNTPNSLAPSQPAADAPEENRLPVNEQFACTFDEDGDYVLQSQRHPGVVAHGARFKEAEKNMVALWKMLPVSSTPAPEQVPALDILPSDYVQARNKVDEFIGDRMIAHSFRMEWVGVQAELLCRERQLENMASPTLPKEAADVQKLVKALEYVRENMPRFCEERLFRAIDNALASFRKERANG